MAKKKTTGKKMPAVPQSDMKAPNKMPVAPDSKRLKKKKS